MSLEMDIFLSHFCAKNGIFSIGKCLWFQLLLSVEGLFLGFFLLNKIFSFESCREKPFFFSFFGFLSSARSWVSFTLAWRNKRGKEQGMVGKSVGLAIKACLVFFSLWYDFLA